MTEMPNCINPIAMRPDIFDDEAFCLFGDKTRAEYINSLKPYIIDFEPTSKCAGSCKYCYASSTSYKEVEIPLETIKEVLNDAYDLGIRMIQWHGGDALMHSQWFDMFCYAAEKGMVNNYVSSSLISKREAKLLAQLGEGLGSVCIHIDTINQEAYNKVHTNPKTLEKKMQGYRNVLEAGIPVSQTMGIITFTKPVVDSVEETLDWFVDEMGTRNVCFVVLKVEGFAGENKHLEPSLDDVTKAIHHRAKKLGDHWLRIGSSDGSKLYCRAALGLTYNGDVTPCLCTRDLTVGNIYQKSLKDLFYAHRDFLLFNFPIKGACGTCQNNDVCFGCRANAYHYTGDVEASDPKCYLNPDAKQYYFRP